jgi:NAD+ kinase
MLAIDPRNRNAAAVGEALLSHWPGVDRSDLVVVVGGDGFMLATVAKYGFERCYLGINAGRVGFLLNAVDDWSSVGPLLQSGQFERFSFSVLQADITTTDGKTIRTMAINDIYLERMTGQTARLSLQIGSESVVDTLVADGIIFATPLGSTGYSLSAGGPIAHPSIDAIFVTPICVHSPRMPPFALAKDAVCQVGVQLPTLRPVRVVADGKEIDNVETISVSFASDRVSLAFLSGHDFTAAQVTKVLGTNQ